MVKLGKGTLAESVGRVGRIHLWSRVDPMQAVKGLFMEKWMCWGAMGVAGLLLLLFLLDLLPLPFKPFGGVSVTVDVLSMLACAVVLYLAWDAMRDLR
jgi:hypothetical protein